jgi:uncharacterized membrane-anchored protein
MEGQMDSSTHQDQQDSGPLSARSFLLNVVGLLAGVLGLFLASVAVIGALHSSLGPSLPPAALFVGGLLLMAAGLDWLRRGSVGN